MLRTHPDTLKWRQILPPLFVLGWLILAGLGVVWQPAWSLLAVQWGVYSLTLLAAALREAVRRRDPALFFGIPLALAVMHQCWGSAFWVGMVMPWSGVASDRTTQ